MQIKLYNKNIFAPNKCGTRYLQTVFDYESFTHLFLPKINGDCYFIIREPIEHLKSALLTQLIHHRDKDYFYELFSKFFIDGGSEAMHFVNILYKKIYYYKTRNENCKIIHLNNLTEFLHSLGYDIEYNKKNYDHSDELQNWCSKDEFYEEIKQKYPNEIKLLEDWMSIENIYYHKLINNDTKNNSII